MSHHCVCVSLSLALWLIPARTEGAFGPGEAAARSSSRSAGQSVDLKVVVWYRKSDSLGTFKYEIYDVRKGEYTPKVDEWVKNVQSKYLGYYVVVRDVDLKREKGGTEMLKVGSVITRELTVAAASAGVVMGSGRMTSPSSSFGSGTGPGSIGSNRGRALNRSPASSSRDRDYLTPAGPLFPVPVPFPRVPR